MDTKDRILSTFVVAALLALIGATPRTMANSLQDLGDSTPSALRSPHIHLVYWGPEWTNGFTSNNVTSSQYRNYLESFLNGLGGSPYLQTQTQYGAGNPFDLFSGQIRLLSAEPPATPTVDDIENVVQLSQQWFGVSRPSAISNQQIFVVALPPGHGDASFAAKGGPACAYHNDTFARVVSQGGSFLGHPIGPATYIVLPFQPDATNCFAFSATRQRDAFGHGVLDGVSKALGHEIAEVLTDPYLGSWRDPDVSGQDETGDKCNTGPMINYGRQTGGIWNYWAVQALWSNSAGHCDLGISGRIVSPLDVNFGLQLIGSPIAPQFVSFQNNGDADVQIGQPGAYWTVDDPSNSFLALGGTCPAVVNPGASCRIGVAFVPHVTGPVSARLTLNAPAANGGAPIPSVQLTGAGTGVPWLATPSNSQFFGDVPVGCFDCSNVRSIVLLNVDSLAHLVARASLLQTSDVEFAIVSDGCSNKLLNPGQSCVLQVNFVPLAGGQRYVVATLIDDRGSSVSLTLSGVGTGAIAQFAGPSLTAATLSMPHAPLGASPVATMTLTTKSTARVLAVGRIGITGPFTQSNDCPSILPPAGTCRITVTGYPTQLGAQAGVLSVPHDGIGGPKEIAVIGAADGTFANVSPLSVRFRKTRVGKRSEPLPIAVAPVENGALHILGLTTTGDFAVQNRCASPIQSRCELQVVFSPQRRGPQTGSLTITTDASNRRQTISLSGRGVMDDDDCDHGEHGSKVGRCDDD